MKNTKKILMILVACLLLVGTAFACIASAAGVTAGESTTIDEYLNFKRVTYDNMEGGSHTSFSQVGNLGQVNSDAKKYVEGIYYWDEYRQGIPGVYEEEGSVSNYFYVFDYNYNITGGDPAHLYVEPQLGVLNNIDKTPTKGFVSEFDIAFFSPLETVYDITKPLMVEKKDENGAIVRDADGNPVMVQGVDKEGNLQYEPVMRSVLERVVSGGKVVWLEYTDGTGKTVKEPKLAPIWIAATDDEGKPLVYAGGEPVMEAKYDENGQLVLDENKCVVLVQSTDRNGNPLTHAKDDPVMVVQQTELKRQLDYDPMTTNFQVQMLNTGTIKDGSKDLLSFSAAKDSNGNHVIKVAVANNLDAESKAQTYTFYPDEWEHFTVQYVAETMMTYIYMGRDDGDGRTLIGQIDGLGKAENQGNALVPVYPLRFRIGSTAKNGIVGLDNFVAYQGITVHDPDFIQKIEEADPDGLFKYFVSILTNDNGKNSAASRLYAFDDIGEYVIKDYYDNGKYTAKAQNNAVLKETVDKYLAYLKDTDGVYSALVVEAKIDNANDFAEYVTKAAAPERNLSNISERNGKISVADEFLASKGTLIDKDGDVYKNADSTLRALKRAITADEAANNFIHYMDLFTNSVNYGASISRIESHVKAAAEIYYTTIEGADYSNLKAADLTKLNNAIATFTGDGTNPSAEEVITLNTANWNSERFIGIVDLIKTYGISDEVFAADDGTIRTLWKMALEITRGSDGVYDENYEGFAEAKAVFNQIHAYFWIAIQSEHIEAIQTKLDTFNNESASYIAKAGICKFVDKYVAANEAYIDFTNETITKLLARNAMYTEQLQSLENDYENLLTQNIIKFVNLISYMQEVDGYATVKALYEEATEYYYSMDLVYDTNGDGKNDVDIDGAVAVYESIRQYLTDVEQDCATFVAATEALKKAETKEETYLALVTCYGSLTNYDETYEGAAEAKAAYDAKYAEYNNEAATVIAHITEANDVACSTRGNWSFDNIVAFVRNLFN